MSKLYKLYQTEHYDQLATDNMPYHEWLMMKIDELECDDLYKYNLFYLVNEMKDVLTKKREIEEQIKTHLDKIKNTKEQLKEALKKIIDDEKDMKSKLKTKRDEMRSIKNNLKQYEKIMKPNDYINVCNFL